MSEDRNIAQQTYFFYSLNWALRDSSVMVNIKSCRYCVLSEASVIKFTIRVSLTTKNIFRDICSKKLLKKISVKLDDF